MGNKQTTEEREFKLGETTVSIDGAVATVTVEPGTFLANTDISEAEFKRVFKYMKSYQENVADAATDAAIDIFTKNKGVEKVVMSVDMGTHKNDSLTATIRKEVTYPGMNGAPDTVKPAVALTTKMNSVFKHKTHLGRCSAKIKEAISGK